MKKISCQSSEGISSTSFIDEKGRWREGSAAAGRKGMRPVLKGIAWCIVVSLLGTAALIIAATIENSRFSLIGVGVVGMSLANILGFVGGMCATICGAFDRLSEEGHDAVVAFLLSSLGCALTLMSVSNPLQELKFL